MTQSDGKPVEFDPVVSAEALQKAMAEKRANRVKEFMNWQTQEQMVEYVDEKERLLFYYALIGTGITKTYFDGGLNRPVCEFVPMDQFVVSYSAPDIRRAEAYTHIIPRSEEEFKRVHSQGAVRAAEWAGKRKIPYVYISSTSVYAEESGGWVPGYFPRVATYWCRSGIDCVARNRTV